MDEMTLREAADRTARSVTTLRRYIRSGRLRAEMRPGRYGPEYFIACDALAQAGVENRRDGSLLPAPYPPAQVAAGAAARETVPMTLYQELQMKHEQLLVQYGMVRAGGLRVLELQAELDARQAQTEALHQEIAALSERLGRETAQLRKRLRESALELEGRALEIAALREKVRALEMLTRNAVTTESIERQFGDVMDQVRKVDRMAGDAEDRKRGH